MEAEDRPSPARAEAIIAELSRKRDEVAGAPARGGLLRRPIVDRDEVHESLVESRRRLDRDLRARLGPIVDILEDPRVADVWRNPDGTIWVKSVGSGVVKIPYTMSDDNALMLISTVASAQNAIVTEDHPFVEGVLPINGARFSAIIPPASHGGPMISIRKRAVLTRTFDEYIDDQTMTEAEAARIRKYIREKLNFLIVGPTGSGKTTLGNTILREMSESAGPDERFAIIEDTIELQCFAPNRFALIATESLPMSGILKTIMRHSPTRICVGEIRGEEGLTLVEAWNTGHDGGLTTIHATNARRALDRLESCIKKSGTQPDRRVIANSVNCIIVIKDVGNGKRKITEIKRVQGVSDTDYSLTDK